LIGPDDPEKTLKTANYFWMDIGDGERMALVDRPDATPDYLGRKDDPQLAFQSTEDEIYTVTRRLADWDVAMREYTAHILS
jgi:hypothetical protein